MRVVLECAIATGTRHLARVLVRITLASALQLVACSPEQASDRRIVTIDRGAYNPSISPDGATIAVGILGKVWLLPVEGGVARQLTFGDGWAHHPVWSRDGERLAWVHDMPASSEIVVHSFGTGTSRTLYGRSPRDVAGGRSWGAVYSFGRMAFHPTNGRLYFVDFRSGIWSVDPTDVRRPEPEQLLAGSGRIGRPGITERSSFAFSPDGNAVVVEKDTTDQWTHLHVTPFGAAEFTQLTSSDTVKRTDASWGADGSSIVYLELAKGRESLAIRSITGGGETRRIGLGPFNGREVTLHPDGNRALVVSARQLMMVDLNTEAVVSVPFQARLSLPSRSRGDLVITNARLFDGTGTDVMDGATVEVRDGRIVAVSTGRWTGGSEARVIDAGGRFLMPGLVESHGHLWVGGNFTQAAVPALGITSIHDAGSYLPETLSLRDAIELGILEGPHIYTSGPTIDGAEGRARPFTIANVTEPDEARALVRELEQLGVDAIKLYAFLRPEVVAATIEEAHALGLPVIGDLVATPWSVALDAGIDGFVHVMDHKWRFISEEQPDPSEGPWAVVEPDSAPMNDFFAKVAARRAMFDPTIMASSQYFEADDFAAALEEWAGADHGTGADEAADGLRPVQRAAILADLLRTMHRHGVRWVAGTDAGPGRLLEEMAIYEMIGIPNATILQTATSNVAQWLKKDDFGTVEPGKRADLILVDGDPLARIRDLENVVLVVQRGRVILEK